MDTNKFVIDLLLLQTLLQRRLPRSGMSLFLSLKLDFWHFVVNSVKRYSGASEDAEAEWVFSTDAGYYMLIDVQCVSQEENQGFVYSSQAFGSSSHS